MSGEPTKARLRYSCSVCSREGSKPRTVDAGTLHCAEVLVGRYGVRHMWNGHGINSMRVRRLAVVVLPDV